MKIYVVGGFVRDHLMGIYPKDKDYVVTGTTEQGLKDSMPFGETFTKVGADFPVYIDGQGNEWALARKERNTGPGYHGFEVDFDPSVTIEEDLGRRDLTVNSIAYEIYDDTRTRVLKHIDPFNGKKDIENKVLRHTSEAFMEDPVRVLRLARFAARFGPEWTVAPETKKLVHDMAKRGDLDDLNGERIWKELSRALMESHPRLFFDTLLECDALHVLFPEVYALASAMENRQYHPEGNSYEHTMLVLTQAARKGFSLETRLACLVHDFGKGLTPKDEFPKHYNHEKTGVAVVKEFCNRNRVPKKMAERAEKVTRYHMHMHRLDEMTAKKIVRMFDDMGALNDPQVVNVLHSTGVCDHQGRLGKEGEDVTNLWKVLDFFDAYASVKFNDVFPEGETNSEKIKQGMYRARISAVKGVK